MLLKQFLPFQYFIEIQHTLRQISNYPFDLYSENSVSTSERKPIPSVHSFKKTEGKYSITEKEPSFQITTQYLISTETKQHLLLLQAA